MIINLLFVGKVNKNPLNEALNEYLSRLENYTRLKMIYVKPPAYTSKTNVNEIKKIEAGLIAKQLKSGDYIILLDERGKEMTTIGFSEWLQNKMLQGTRDLVFVIGGAFGFSDDIKLRANLTLSLSKLTFPHQVAHLVLVEQLYRAFTILKNESYHHD